MIKIPMSEGLTRELACPYYADEWTHIYHNNGLAVMLGMPAKAFDLALFDPPYNAGKNYGTTKDRMPEDEYRMMMGAYLWQAMRIARIVVVTPGNIKLPLWYNLKQPDMTAWYYKPATGGITYVAHNVRTHWRAEPILAWFPSTIEQLTFDSVLTGPATKREKVGGHPNVYPEWVFSAIISRLNAQSVIDPFCGSGTTLAAAKRNGAVAVGIDINIDYCTLSVERVRQATIYDAMGAEQRDLLAGGGMGSKREEVLESGHSGEDKDSMEGTKQGEE